MVDLKYKFVTQDKFVCHRHMLKQDTADKKGGITSIKSILERSQIGAESYTIFSDPPLTPGTDEILRLLKCQLKQPKRVPNSANFHEEIDIQETLEMMENQLMSAIEKGAKILHASKDINYEQKMDLVYRHDNGGKKIGSDEVYILSQKNLVKTMENLNGRAKDLDDELTNVEQNTDLEGELMGSIETVKQEVKQEVASEEIIPNIIVRSPTYVHSNGDVQPQSDGIFPTEKPLSGFRRTASVMSRLLGGDIIKKRIKKEVEKQYDDLYNFVLKDSQN